MASYGSMPCDGLTSTRRAYGLILRRDELADRVAHAPERVAALRRCVTAIGQAPPASGPQVCFAGCRPPANEKGRLSRRPRLS